MVTEKFSLRILQNVYTRTQPPQVTHVKYSKHLCQDSANENSKSFDLHHNFQLCRFLFLSLLATALAAPQYPYNMYYPGLSYQPMPVGYNPAVVRGVYNPYPMYPSAYPLVPQQQQPIQRGLISFENLLQVNGKFKTDDTTTPAMVVSGTFEFDQNFGTDLLYGNNAHYKIYINSGSTDLTGKNVALKFASSCAATDGTVMISSLDIWKI